MATLLLLVLISQLFSVSLGFILPLQPPQRAYKCPASHPDIIWDEGSSSYSCRSPRMLQYLHVFQVVTLVGCIFMFFFLSLFSLLLLFIITFIFYLYHLHHHHSYQTSHETPYMPPNTNSCCFLINHSFIILNNVYLV